MYKYLYFFWAPFQRAYDILISVTFDPKAVATEILNDNDNIYLGRSIRYLFFVIAIAFVLFSVIINVLTGQQPIEFYYTTQSLLIYMTGYAIFITLSVFFSKIEIRKTVTILNFSIGSGHLLLYAFLFISFSTIYTLMLIGYIPDIKVNLRDWENLEKTFIQFLTSCAIEKFYLFNFLFAANQVILVNFPFQYLFFINFVSFFAYMLIASYMIRFVFGESKPKFFVIGTSSFLLTFALWNAANLYGLYYVQHHTACGEIAMRQAKSHTAESMLKKYYQDEYDTDVSYLDVEKVTVKGSHISRIFRIKDDANQIDRIKRTLRQWRSKFQDDICNKDFYSNFRELGVSVTEIYKFQGRDFYRFTVAAADCS